MVEYKKEDLLGGWSIKVIAEGSVLGHIRKHGQDGGFVYFRGPDNQLNGSLQDQDLGALKVKIEATLR